MSSKASIKNQKRREKKKDEKITNLVKERKLEEGRNVVRDPGVAMKAKLAEAKESGDHKLAAKLRQDLWVLQDASSGVSIKLEEEDVQESFERITAQKLAATPLITATVETRKVIKPDTTTSTSTQSTLSPFEKDLRKIKKKLEQIEKLKKMQEDGGTLEDTQLEKISKEEEFKKEISDIEDRMLYHQ